MKSILFVVLIASAISSSFAAKMKGSCPKPEKPKFERWLFVNNFIGSWEVIGRSEMTIPRTVRNTLDIKHLFAGKVAVIEKGQTRDSEVLSMWDKYVDMKVGDFNGKSFYEVMEEEQPYSFNITTSDGHRGQFWMPYYANPKHEEAVVASCVKIDDSTVDVKAWFISKSKWVSPSQKVKDLVKSLTGQNYITVCQTRFC